MSKANIIKTNFSSGEVSPLVYGRSDTVKYQNGAREVFNTLTLPQGGAWRRPGTKYIAEVADSTKTHRLIPFEFSSIQPYIIELGDQTLRVMRNDEFILGNSRVYVSNTSNASGEIQITTDSVHGLTTGDTVIVDQVRGTTEANGEWTVTVVDTTNFTLDGSTYTNAFDPTAGFISKTTLQLTTPWTADELEGIDFAQSADVLYLVHRNHPPYRLERWSAYHWSLEKVETADGPYEADDSLTQTFKILKIEDNLGTIRVFTTAQNLISGVYVTISGVEGTTEANGTWEVNVTNETTVDLIGSFYSNTYTGGGIMVNKAKVRVNAIVDRWTLKSSSATEPKFDDATFAVGDLIELPVEGRWQLFKLVSTDTDNPETIATFTRPPQVDGIDPEITVRSKLVDKILEIPAGVQSPTSQYRHNSASAPIVIESSQSGSFLREHVGLYLRVDRYGGSPGNPVTNGETGNNWRLIDKFHGRDPDKVIATDIPSGEGHTWIYGTERITILGRTRTCALTSDINFFENAAVGDIYRFKMRGIWVWGRCKTVDSDVQVTVDFFEDIPYDAINPNDGSGGVIPADNGFVQEFKFGAWSSVNGYPSTVTFHEQRLVFGGTDNEPQTFWMSVSSDFHNFRPTELDGTVLDDNAVTATLASSKVQAISWMRSTDALIIGTIGGEWVVKAASTVKEPITPNNINAQEHTHYGSPINVHGHNIGEGIVYVQRNQRKVYDTKYTFADDKWQASDLTIAAEHMLRDGSGCDRLVYQEQPYQTLWCQLSDGSLAALTFNREQQVSAWTSHSIGGSGVVESIAVLSGSTQDDFYLIVKRTINGATKRYIEKMNAFQYPSSGTDIDNLIYMDSAITVTNSPASTTVSGLSHLEGEAVAVLADGVVVDGLTVSSGAITLPDAASTIQVGLAYTSRIYTLPFEGGSREGTSMGINKRIPQATFNVYRTPSLQAGADLSDLDEYSLDSGNLFTGLYHTTIPNHYGHDVGVYIVQSDPLPMVLLGLTVQQYVSE